MDDWVQFGRLVRGARHRSGLSQEQLAARCGVSVRTLGDIERGRTRSPHRSVLRVGELLGLSAPPSGNDPGSGVDEPEIRVLGPLSLRVGAADLRLASMMQRIVLGLLLVRPGEPVGRDQLVDVLWGDRPPPSCVNLVQTYVARLRRALAPLGVLTIDSVPGGYRLSMRAEPTLVDVLAFTTAVTAARRAHGTGDATGAAALFASALDLWRGPVLADLDDRVRAHPAVISLQRARLAAAVEYAALALVLPAPEAAVTRLLTVTRDEPLHEALHARLMLLLAASGQQADALAVYDGVRTRLAEDLGVQPGPELRDAQSRVLRQDLPRRVATRAHPRWLGPRCRRPDLVGRETEQTHLTGLLPAHRVVTVTGPAGCGKSALALSTAERHDGNVVVLRLTALAGGDLPLSALADLLGTGRATADATLADTAMALAGPGDLLVLDDAEHIVPSVAALVEQLLGSCPRLTVLVTSRQPLGVAEEVTWQLGALPVPIADEPSPATELFCSRARQAFSAVDLSDTAAIGRLTRRLDGLPLALELIAAQVRALPVAQVEDRLEALLGLRTASAGPVRAGDRHRSMRAAIDWSYALLTPVEQRLLAELSVFDGVFGVEDAESVSGQRAAVLPAMVSLAEKSLLAVEDGGGTSRFRLLATVRGYAAARLAESGASPVRQDAPADPALRQLPMDIAEFTGRQNELARLRAWADEPSSPSTAVTVCAIVGMGGIGKTRLAVRAAHQFARHEQFDQVQLWADLRGFHPDQPPADPAAVLERFLHLLGVPAGRVPADLEERADLYRACLSGKRALVLLDDVASEEQVHTLLPGSAGCLVLLTSRRALTGLDGLRVLPLEVLSTADAVALLEHGAGADRLAAEQDAAERIVALCGHLPIAVALASRHLRNRPSWRLRDLVERLENETQRVAQLSTRTRSVRATFELSYQSLPAVQQRLLGLLTLHPGSDFAAPSVAALTGLPLPQVESTMESLLDEHLLQQAVPGRYRMHDLIRLCAREQTGREDGVAVTRVVDHYLAGAEHATVLLYPTEPRRLAPVSQRRPCPHITFDTAAGAVTWVESEYDNLVATARQAAEGAEDVARTAVRLIAALYRPLANRGHTGDRIMLNRLAVRTAARLGDRAGEALALEDTGSLCSQDGQFDEALAHMREALAIWTELGDSRGQQACLADLGHAHRLLGQVPDATEYLERSLAISRRAGYGAGEASVLNYLGLLHQSVNDYELAMDCHRQSRRKHHQLGNRLGAAIATANLGWAQQRAGLSDRAIGNHETALLVFRELGDRYNEAEQLWGLGQARHALGNGGQARAHWRESILLLRDLGALDEQQSAALLGQEVPDIPEIIRLNT